MYSLIKEMVDSYGVLTEVREGERLGANGPVSITLAFEHGSVLVAAQPDADTITMRAVTSADGANVSAERPWRDAVGRGLIWIWTLRNQHGYEDGCQLEFGDVTRHDRPRYLCVQLVVAASTLHVATVNGRI
jgi:Family of unknown function (DUF6334)